MLDIRNRLYVFWDDNGTFSDISQSMMDYGRNSESVELNSAEDYLYVGFTKPINRFYLEMATNNATANNLTAEYYNGTAFSSLSSFLDDSRGFTRSGFISWERPIDSDNKTLEESTTVNGQSAFWYRFRPSATHDVGTSLQGLNIVFSDNEDIKQEAYELATDNRYLPSGASSHILQLQSSRDDIIQELRRWQNRKKADGATFTEDIQPWDLLDATQVRLASNYLTVAKIYFNLSDDPGDTEAVKSQMYMQKYKDAMNLYIIEIDKDDDGVRETDDFVCYPKTHFLGR